MKTITAIYNYFFAPVQPVYVRERIVDGFTLEQGDRVLHITKEDAENCGEYADIHNCLAATAFKREHSDLPLYGVGSDKIAFNDSDDRLSILYYKGEDDRIKKFYDNGRNLETFEPITFVLSATRS